MKIIAHIHRRRLRRVVVLLAIVSVVAAVGARLAFARSTTPVGTGIVVVNTVLGYEDGEAAGTGMVLTSSGEVLTNNHVIEAATKITVSIPNTSRTYTARVVGYDVSDDVAVLQLVGASNLKTVSVATASAKVGERVTGVGNAGGTGTLASASGTITGVGKSITASDDEGGVETLTSMLETNAAIVAGDSGGPLLTSSGRVLGMITAGSTSGGGPFQFQQTSASDAYAIPIAKALSIAKLVQAGTASATVHIGGTAFLGVEVGDDLYGQTGADVVGVTSGGPAASAGLAAGDVITAVAGQTVSSASDLKPILLTLKPGAQVAIDYTDAAGTHTATVTLGTGPAQ